MTPNFERKALIKSIEDNAKSHYVGGINFEIKQAKEGEEKEQGSRTFVMSKEVRDRHGDIVILKGGHLDNYNASPVVLSMHESSRSYRDTQPYDWDQVLGKGFAYLKDGVLYNDILFEPEDINPLAAKVVKKIDFGSVRAGSIGFMPLKGHWGQQEDGEDTGTYYITEWELWEFSIVVIGSNPQALIESSKKATSEQLNDEDLQEKKNTNKGATAVRLAHINSLT